MRIAAKREWRRLAPPFSFWFDNALRCQINV
jgi:hypothetical protein